jgi:hypothetical protein
MAQLDFFFAARGENESKREGVSAAQLELLDSPPPRARPAPPPKRIEATRFRVSIDGQVRLESALRSRLGPRTIVKQTTNRSTMISFRRRGHALYVRVHAMFGTADDRVLDALGEFISKDEISTEHATLLDDFIERNRPQLNEVRSRTVPVRPYGEVHDLQSIYEQLNETYFESKVDARITWSHAQKKKKRRTSINMGTYSDELRLIRIHPALDQAWVPRFFVEAVVFHEMLHQIHDVKEEGGRRCIHTAEFRRDERRFPRFKDAQVWERKNLRRLLRY